MCGSLLDLLVEKEWPLDALPLGEAVEAMCAPAGTYDELAVRPLTLTPTRTRTLTRTRTRTRTRTVTRTVTRARTRSVSRRWSRGCAST